MNSRDYYKAIDEYSRREGVSRQEAQRVFRERAAAARRAKKQKRQASDPRPSSCSTYFSDPANDPLRAVLDR